MAEKPLLLWGAQTHKGDFFFTCIFELFYDIVYNEPSIENWQDTVAVSLVQKCLEGRKINGSK